MSLGVGAPVGLVVQVGHLVVRLDSTVTEDHPDAPPDLVGRAGELAVIAQHFGTGRPGVVLTGPPGAGSTTVARAWAVRSALRTVWVDLVDEQPDDPSPTLWRALRNLGVAEGYVPADLGSRRALYRSLLAAQPALVVLDGVRTETQARTLAPGAGTPAVVTSHGDLPGLVADGWTAVPVGPLAVADAAALLRSGGLSGPGWDDDDAVATLLSRCGCLPRTLRLLAHGVPVGATPAGVLSTIGPDASSPDDPVEVAWALAVAAVDPPARVLLRGPVGPVDRAIVAALLGTDEDTAVTTLADLAHRGLLDPVPGTRIYRPARREIREGRTPGRPTIGVPPAATGPPRGPAASDPAASDPATSLPLPSDPASSRPAPSIAVSADTSDVEHVCRLAATALHRAGDTAGEAAVRLRLARIALDDRRPAEALERASLAMVLFTVADDALGTGRSMTEIAAALVGMGEPAAALDACERALVTLTGATVEVAWALVTRGDALAALDRDAEGREAQRAAAALFAAAGHAAGSVRAWRRIAESYLRSGDAAAALDAYRHALAGLGTDPHAVALAGLLDGRVHVEVGRVGPVALAEVALTATGPDTGDAAEVTRGVRVLLRAAGLGDAVLALRAVIE